jgi:hypothetical protein
VTVTATQASLTAPPVLVATTGLPIVDAGATGAVTGIVQRRSDGVTWVTVRGGMDMEIDGSGEVEDLSDYEFRPGEVNTYRAGTVQRIVDTFARTETDNWDTADTGQVWDAANAAFDVAAGYGTIVHTAAATTFLTYLATPTDIGDLDMGVSAKISAADITGAAVEVLLFAHVVDANNRYELALHVATNETMSLTARSVFGGVTTDLETSAIPAVHASSSTVYRVRWRIDGNRLRARAWGAGVTPEYREWHVDTVVPTAMRISGGKVGLGSVRAGSNSNANITFSLTDFTVYDGVPSFPAGLSDDITPGLAGVWFCSTMRSFLNCAPMIIEYGEPSRGARGGASYVAGRTLPIGQVELSTGRSWGVTVRLPSLASARRFEYLVASGDVFYVLAPEDCPVPAGFYQFGDVDSDRVTPRSDKRTFESTIVERAAPGPDVKTASATWASVTALYGDWPAVVLAQPTWETLKELIGDPSEVVVP